MFGQRIEFADAGTIAVLVLLEALLSADNALVLAIMVRHLPRELQKKALMYGLGGAFVLRTLAILAAAIIIGFWWLQLLGALYLLYLPAKHFHSHHQEKKQIQVKKLSFWATVAYLELVDVGFALDSVLAAVAVVDTVRHPDKLWVVIAGAVVGIVVLRFAASYFIRLLEKYPTLDHVAYLLVGWAGFKLLLISGHSFETWLMKAHRQALAFHIPEMPTWLFWTGMLGIAGIGGWLAFRNPKDPNERDEPSETLEPQAERMEEIMRVQIHDRDTSEVPEDVLRERREPSQAPTQSDSP